MRRLDTGTNEFKIRNIPVFVDQNAGFPAAAGGRSSFAVSEPSGGDWDAAPGLPGAADKRLDPLPSIPSGDSGQHKDGNKAQSIRLVFSVPARF